MGKHATSDIRNLALVGHGGTGKTTFLEHLLHAAKETGKIGSVEKGDTVSDYDDDEKERGHSIIPSIAHCEWNGRLLNIVDAPGYPDFLGGAVAALAAVETAVVMVNAQNGVEVNTRRVWQQAERMGRGRIIVVNRMDGDNVNWENVLGQIRDAFGVACTPFLLPVGQGADFSAVVRVLGDDDAPDGVIGDLDGAREALMDAIVSADDALMERYLEEGGLKEEEVSGAVGKAILEGTLVPVLPMAGEKEIGLKEVADALAAYAPPADAPIPRGAVKPGTDEEVEVKPIEDAPFSARVFKTEVDDFVGKLAFLRVYSGTLKANDEVFVPRLDDTVKMSQLFTLQGKEQESVDGAKAGEIVAVAKVEELEIGDTLCDPDNPVQLPAAGFPVPMVSLAVTAKSRGEEGKVVTALRRLADADATFTVERRPTGETVISGMSDLHLRVMLERLKRKGYEVDTKPPRIPYRETVTGQGESKYRHKKQSGGAGQFAEVHLRVSATERGEGFQFESSVVGGNIPTQFIPSVEKGIKAVLEEGIMAGCPVVDVVADVFDGKHHPVDSKDIAFQIAGRNAFKEAFMAAKPVLLEPVVNLEITIPSEFMGDISGDMNTRRGRIQGMDQAGDMQVIEAQVPLAEVANYATELKSMTGGEGSYTLEFSHYDVVPPNVAQQVMAAYQKEDKEED